MKKAILSTIAAILIFGTAFLRISTNIIEKRILVSYQELQENIDTKESMDNYYLMSIVDYTTAQFRNLIFMNGVNSKNDSDYRNEKSYWYKYIEGAIRKRYLATGQLTIVNVKNLEDLCSEAIEGNSDSSKALDTLMNTLELDFIEEYGKKTQYISKLKQDIRILEGKKLKVNDWIDFIHFIALFLILISSYLDISISKKDKDI